MMKANKRQSFNVCDLVSAYLCEIIQASDLLFQRANNYYYRGLVLIGPLDNKFSQVTQGFA